MAHQCEMADGAFEAMQAMQRTLLALIEGCQGDERPDCPILDDLGGLHGACSGHSRAA